MKEIEFLNWEFSFVCFFFFTVLVQKYGNFYLQSFDS